MQENNVPPSKSIYTYPYYPTTKFSRNLMTILIGTFTDTTNPLILKDSLMLIEQHKCYKKPPFFKFKQLPQAQFSSKKPVLSAISKTIKVFNLN